MNCLRCGSKEFEEENGLFYCRYCQTQSQGFLQESEQVFTDYTKFSGKEVLLNRRQKQKSKQRKTGVLWTTTEAFNIILLKQMNTIYEMMNESIDLKSMKDMTCLIWFSYLRKSGLAFTDGESDQQKIPTRRLHPASRFRDQQILTNRVDQHLPDFKNGSTSLGFRRLFKLGADRVIRTVEESEGLKDFESVLNEETDDFLDIFGVQYRDPRNYAKYKSKELKISRETRKQLMKLLSQMDLQTSFEKTLDLMEETDGNESIDELTEIDDNSDVEEQKLSEDMKNSLKDIDKYDDYDKELMANLPETTKLFSKHIPLSYLKDSRNNSTEYFIDLMSLPKTLAILNIVFRLLSLDVFTFDLIRWAIEGHIPYTNCLTCLPDDWLLISNDFHTFTSNCIPSTKRINALSVQIAKHIRIQSFPRPNIKVLLIRLVRDLNLPKDLVNLIQTKYNIFEHFSKCFDQKMNKFRTIKELPHFERWALMAVILVLKRLFILNDSSEKRLSLNAPKDQDLFIWSDWEKYARLRLELIRSYFISSDLGNLEDIRDVDLIADHILEGTEYEVTKKIETKRKANYRSFDFRTTIQTDFNTYLLNKTEFQSSEPLKPSLYPLTNATDFALKRINSSSMTQLMAVSFEEQSISAWSCSHGKAFHREYELLSSDANQWSSSFKLLIQLSCFVLNCRTEDLIPTLNQMQKSYFGLKSD